MREYRDIILTTLILYLLGGLLILWGYNNDGTVRIIFGVLIIVLFTKNGIDNYKYIQELKLWRRQNNGKLIFFYPTKKDIQVEIEKQIFPILPKDILKVHYDGPSLVGDIKRSVMVELMNQYKEIQVNSPAIFKIVDNKIHIESLPELKGLNSTITDLSAIKHKIDKIANA
ncbi:MAG: hypothetical protein MUC87_00705 [Bacteroidia bacterium]|jgi:hypothetical protein|nr:hypothetical protein [Bacteroidia bacterium]